MAAGRSIKNNTIAGVFVLASLTLAVLVIVVLSGLEFSGIGMTPYVINFNLKDGAMGLEGGAQVTLGGKKIGRVTGSDFATSTDGRITGIDVSIEVRSDIPLTGSADVRLVKPLLGTTSTINIAGLGDGQAVPPGTTIAGRLGPPAFIAESDYERLQGILTNVDGIIQDVRPQIEPTVRDFRETVANVRRITDDVNAAWPSWKTQVDDVLARVHKGSEQFESIVGSVRSGIDEVRAVVAQVHEGIAANRAGVDETIENVRVLTRNLKGEGYERVMQALQTGQEGLAYFRDTLKNADELLIEKSPQIKDIVGNAALAAQQLKLATVEIRAAPWRLLYQPGTKELENELLYNSVRAYSESVGELRAAAESLEAIAQRQAAGDAPDIDPRVVENLTVKLNDALAKYHEQERRFFERWVDEGGRAGGDDAPPRAGDGRGR